MAVWNMVNHLPDGPASVSILGIQLSLRQVTHRGPQFQGKIRYLVNVPVDVAFSNNGWSLKRPERRTVILEIELHENNENP